MKMPFIVASFSLVLLLLLSCAPKAAPAPVPTPAAPAPAAPAPSVPALAPEQAAWAKVMDAARKEGKLTVYSYAWVGEIGVVIARAFKEKYGISLEIITGRGAEFTERLKTEKRLGQTVADLTEGSSVHLDSMKMDGLLVSVVKDLPVMRQKVWHMEPTAIDPTDKANLVWRLIVYTPYINTKLVKPENAPQSWKELLKPEWKGRMSLTDPKLGSHIAQWFVGLSENKIIDEDYIRALNRQDLRFHPGLPQEFPALAKGESYLQIVGSDATAARFVMEGAPIQAIDMKDGILLSTASVAAVAGGPNPDAARVFLNWLFSPEGQTVAGKALGNKVVHRDVPDFRPKGVQTGMTNPLVMKLEHLDKATQMFRERWFDKVTGR